jgi:hypothetical protein
MSGGTPARKHAHTQKDAIQRVAQGRPLGLCGGTLTEFNTHKQHGRAGLIYRFDNKACVWRQTSDEIKHSKRHD